MESSCISRCCLCNKDEEMKLNTGKIHGMCSIHIHKYTVGDLVTCIHCNEFCEINIKNEAPVELEINLQMINQEINSKHPDEIKATLGNLLKHRQNLNFTIEIERKCMKCEEKNELFKFPKCEYHFICRICYENEEIECVECKNHSCMMCEELCFPIKEECRHLYCENCLRSFNTYCPLCYSLYGVYSTIKQNGYKMCSFFPFFRNFFK